MTENKGDLISREALKKELDELFESGGYDSGLVINTIDNAPTVAKDYDTGYQDGLEDGLNDIRPQGKWIDGKINRTHFPNYCKCSICNYCDYHNDKSNFCPYCGADMRGKEE